MENHDYIIAITSYSPDNFISGDIHPISDWPMWNEGRGEHKEYRNHTYLFVPDQMEEAFLPVAEHYGIGLVECEEINEMGTDLQLRDAVVKRCMKTPLLFVVDDHVVIKPRSIDEVPERKLYNYCYSIIVNNLRGWFRGAYIEEMYCARNGTTIRIKSEEFDG